MQVAPADEVIELKHRELITLLGDPYGASPVLARGWLISGQGAGLNGAGQPVARIV
jgi:hypothetical protein